MERKPCGSEPLDRLIKESLQDNLGPPPSPEIWARIAGEIRQPPRRRWTDWLVSSLSAPVVQSAFIVALLMLLVGPPALHELSQPDVRPAIVPVVLPYEALGRPVPEADLRPSEEAELDETVGAGAGRIPLAKLPTIEAP